MFGYDINRKRRTLRFERLEELRYLHGESCAATEVAWAEVEIDQPYLLSAMPAEGEGALPTAPRRFGRNPIDPLDVTNDGEIRNGDVFALVAELRDHGSHAVPNVPLDSLNPVSFFDITDDHQISNQDVFTLVAALRDGAGMNVGQLVDQHAPLSGIMGSVEYDVARNASVVECAFRVAVQGGPASALLNVSVGGVVVGQVATDVAGQGLLRFSNHPVMGVSDPFPSNFPDITPGVQVMVGPTGVGQFRIDDLADPPFAPSPPESGAESSATIYATGLGYAAVELELEKEGTFTRAEFNVQLERHAPGSYTVQVNGLNLGAVSVGANGRGRMAFANESGPGITLLPIELPLDGTWNISIGNGTTVALSVQTPAGENPGDETILFVANLTGAPSATGSYTLSTQLQGTDLVQRLRVVASNLAANSTFDLIIDGVVIGSMTTNASGAGLVGYSTHPEASELPMPLNLPDIGVGVSTAIGVVLTGPFAEP